MTTTALTSMVRTEARLVARDTAGLIIPLALPILILVMNQLGIDRATASTQDIKAFTAIIVPVTLVLVATMIGVVNMPSSLATHRTTGVLRRLAVTPFGATVDALASAWLGGTSQPAHLLALAACAVVSAAVATKMFRWQ